MNILVISQYYFPEQFKITDICEQLFKMGNNITVVTGLPNYPEGKIYSGYEKKKNITENINGVEVLRCSIIPRGKGTIKRFLNYYSYVIKAKKTLKKVKKQFDIIFVFEISPVMQIIPALYYKKKYNIPVVVYCQDLWPEALTIGGIKKDSLIYKYFWKVSKKLYSKSDILLVTSPSFINYLLNFNSIKKEQIIYLPQHSTELCKSTPEKTKDTFINLLYTGNIGKIQNVDVMISSMIYLKEYKVKMHIVGNGSEFEKCQKIVYDNNLEEIVLLHGWKKREELLDFYKLADACIMSLSNNTFIGNTIPSKLQDYMSIGRPILAAISGDSCNIIDEARCGIYCKPDSIDDFVLLIKKYIKDKEKYDLYGKNAREYFEKNYKLEKFSDELIKIMEMVK